MKNIPTGMNSNLQFKTLIPELSMRKKEIIAIALEVLQGKKTIPFLGMNIFSSYKLSSVVRVRVLDYGWISGIYMLMDFEANQYHYEQAKFYQGIYNSKVVGSHFGFDRSPCYKVVGVAKNTEVFIIKIYDDEYNPYYIAINAKGKSFKVLHGELGSPNWDGDCPEAMELLKEHQANLLLDDHDPYGDDYDKDDYWDDHDGYDDHTFNPGMYYDEESEDELV